MFNVVPVLVKSVMASAIPMNGAISVEPVSLTIFISSPLSLRYFLVRFGNSVAIVIPSFKSSLEFIFESSGDASTSLVWPNSKSVSISTSASASLIKSRPEIPMSHTPSSTNSGISAARANITSMFLL